MTDLAQGASGKGGRSRALERFINLKAVLVALTHLSFRLERLTRQRGVG